MQWKPLPGAHNRETSSATVFITLAAIAAAGGEPEFVTAQQSTQSESKLASSSEEQAAEVEQPRADHRMCRRMVGPSWRLSMISTRRQISMFGTGTENDGAADVYLRNSLCGPYF